MEEWIFIVVLVIYSLIITSLWRSFFHALPSISKKLPACFKASSTSGRQGMMEMGSLVL